MVLLALRVQDLSRLCLCRKWYTEQVRPVLYSDITIAHENDYSFLPQRTWRLLLTLIEHPHLARGYIKRIYVHIFPSPGDDPAKLQLHWLLVLQINAIVRQATDLRWFQYIGPHPNPTKPCFELRRKKRLTLLVAKNCTILGDLSKIEQLFMTVPNPSGLLSIFPQLQCASLRSAMVTHRSNRRFGPNAPLFAFEAEHLRWLNLVGFECGDRWPQFDFPMLEEIKLSKCSDVIVILSRLRECSRSSLRAVTLVDCDFTRHAGGLDTVLPDFDIRRLCLMSKGGDVTYDERLPSLPGLKTLKIGNMEMISRPNSTYRQLRLFARLFPNLEHLTFQVPMRSHVALEERDRLELNLRHLVVTGLPDSAATESRARHLARPLLGEGRAPIEVRINDRAWSIVQGPTRRQWALVTSVPVTPPVPDMPNLFTWRGL